MSIYMLAIQVVDNWLSRVNLKNMIRLNKRNNLISKIITFLQKHNTLTVILIKFWSWACQNLQMRIWVLVALVLELIKTGQAAC